MPKKPQTPEDHAETRARILQVAREVYDSEGYAAVTMRNIARRTGYSPAALYRYFTNHVELVRGIWQSAVDTMRDDAAVVAAAHDDPTERIAALLKAYASFAHQQSAAFRSTFLQVSVPKPDIEIFRQEGSLPYLDHREGTAYRLLREAAGDAITAGQLTAMDPDLAAQTLWGAIHGIASLPFHFRKFPLADADERIEAAITILLRGMGAKGLG